MLTYANNFCGFAVRWLLPNTCKHLFKEQRLSTFSKLSAMKGFSGARAEYKVFFTLNTSQRRLQRREKCDKSKTTTTDMLLMS